jgi:hypothetical protein
MTKKKEGLTSGKRQELIDLLEIHNIIKNKDVAIDHANKLVPIAHQFIKDITSTISIEDYKDSLNEFIEMAIASQTYVASTLLICLNDMFPDIPLSVFVKNYQKSLDESLALQIRNHVAE